MNCLVMLAECLLSARVILIEFRDDLQQTHLVRSATGLRRKINIVDAVSWQVIDWSAETARWKHASRISSDFMVDTSGFGF
jgi:hypothetical protein